MFQALEPTKQNLRPASGAWRPVAALVLREMSTVYGRRPGGYVWALIEPVGMIIILAFAFSLVLRSPSLGSSFIVFYASGFLPFLFFNDIARVVGNAFGYSKALLRYPAVSWIHAILARFVLYALTGVVVGAVILTGVIIASGTNAILDFQKMFVAYLAAGTLAAGVGTMNAVLNGLWPLWKAIWAIATRPLMIASAVLYILEDLPRAAQDIMWYNPVIHITTTFRQGVFVTYKPQFVSLTYVFAIGLVLLALGLLLLRRFHLRILEEH